MFPKDRFDGIETHCIETYGRMESCVTGRIPREVHAPHDFQTRDIGYVSPASLSELQNPRCTTRIRPFFTCGFHVSSMVKVSSTISYPPANRYPDLSPV